MLASLVLFFLGGSDYLSRDDFQSPVRKVKESGCQNILGAEGGKKAEDLSIQYTCILLFSLLPL